MASGHNNDPDRLDDAGCTRICLTRFFSHCPKLMRRYERIAAVGPEQRGGVNWDMMKRDLIRNSARTVRSANNRGACGDTLREWGHSPLNRAIHKER